MTPKKHVEGFPKLEKRATQNYFPILVILILVVCLSAGIALAFASASMDAIQRWALIFFLMAFSICGLVFSLFGATASEWLTMREWRKVKALENNDKIAWDVLPPLAQRRKLTAEVRDLAAILGVPSEQMSDLLSAYVVAEDLALRQIQQEEKVPLMRHITIGNAEFDAILIKEELITFIEVAFLVTPKLSKEKCTQIIKKVETAKQILAKVRPESKVKLLMVLVTQLDDREVTELRSLIGKKLFPETPVDIDIRLRDFEELQKTFAL
ncbi:MAG: hypothetical protein ABIP06_07690 [Pyrinomonadaceae bacterium]